MQCQQCVWVCVCKNKVQPMTDLSTLSSLSTFSCSLCTLTNSHTLSVSCHIPTFCHVPLIQTHRYTLALCGSICSALPDANPSLKYLMEICPWAFYPDTQKSPSLCLGFCPKIMWLALGKDWWCLVVKQEANSSVLGEGREDLWFPTELHPS